MTHYPGIQAHFDFRKPEEIEATMHVTMSIKKWTEIADALSPDRFAEWPLRAAINDLVRQARVVLFTKVDDKA